MVKESEVRRIREVLEQYPKGLTIEDVSQKLELNRGTAAKYLNLLVVSGQAQMRNLGPAKLFSLSHRIPLSQMLSFSSDPILILDDDLFIHQVNDALLAVFGLEREALVGERILQSPLSANMTPRHFEIIMEALDGEEKDLEEEIEIKGESRPFSMKLLPLVFDQGTRGLGLILREIPGPNQPAVPRERSAEPDQQLVALNQELEGRIREHRKIEKALAESEEQYRALVENIPEVIFTLNDRGAVTYISPVIRRVSEYEPADLLGRPLQDLVFKDDMMAFVRGMEFGRPGATGIFEIRMIARDGSPRWVRVSAKPVLRDSAVVGIQGIIIDIQERKRAEDALRRASKQIILLNSVTRHDILNGLTRLLGYLGLLRSQTKSRKLSEIFDREQEVIQTLQQQINFTRDYQNIGLSPPRWIGAGEYIRLAASGIDLGKIALEVDLDGIEIFADDLIERVFANFLSNAVQHGGHVTRIRFFSEKNKKNLVIVCQDDGAGIPETEKEKIFEHTSSGRMSYGLFFSREVLAITGITVQESGKEGSGARFELIVPDGAYRGIS